MRLIARLFAAALALTACAGTALADDYVLGKQYSMVNEKAPPSDPNKVTVEEFFWYGCPHCYALEPYLNAWAKKAPSYVKLVHVPNSLGRAVGEVHQRAFYIAQVLGIEDKIRQPMFDGLKHVEEGDPALTTLDDIRALYVKDAGIKPEDFDSVAHSFAIDGDVRRADQLAMSYGVTSTPTLVVDGRWMTSVAQAGGFEGLPKLLDYLTEKARKERGIK